MAWKNLFEALCATIGTESVKWKQPYIIIQKEFTNCWKYMYK